MGTMGERRIQWQGGPFRPDGWHYHRRHEQRFDIRAVPSRELIARIFGAFGMKANQASRTCRKSVIKQMGGLQGVGFQIVGVRT